MQCVILQPSYIPWRGYFHQIHKADIFVFYDDVQYDKHGWRNRNLIKSRNGKAQWLTIPVHSKGAPVDKLPINEIRICWSKPWNRTHWKTIKQVYCKAPYFQRYAPLLEEFYQQTPVLLADFTIELSIALAREMGISHTRFIRSSSLQVSGSRMDRLINIIRAVGATRYISGPSARSYIEAERFREESIELEYMSYDYPEYEQLASPFTPQVSILDLLFMTGPDALGYILSPGQNRGLTR